MAFSLARRHDRWLVPLMVVTPLAVLGVFIAAGVVFDHIYLLTMLGIALAAMATLVVFGRRASAAAYAEVEGRPGAAASVLQTMRGAWRVQPAVGFTRNQDLVHRAVGRPGVVLVAEGSPHRVSQLITQEKRRVGRIAPDVPVYEVIVGEGGVPLRKLQSHLGKLPKNLKPAHVRELDNRLKALGSGPPLPKGMRSAMRGR